jgi:N-acyl-D-amino-acid deacylase
MDMYDIVIRNGTIIDGTNTEPYLGELAIDGDTIVAVGPPGTVTAGGRREIDADGQIVTPGWVDMHTHYDAQATWDPYLTPAGWHGVTTVVMGNCGVGFAPAHAHSREWLIRLMEGVEDIPGAALTDGISWEWETFPEYLDALDRREFIADIGAQMPHGALRAYVMGGRSADGIEATPEEIRKMAELTEEALRAGALGFSTSRTPLHKSVDGDLVPGTSADSSELIGIAKGMAAAGHGVFECALHHPEVPESFGWLREIARITRHPVVFNFNINDRHPNLWKDVLGLCEKAHDDGLAVHGQVAGRPVGILQCWDGTLNPFIGRPSFEALADLDRVTRLAELVKPAVKAAILAEQHPDASEFLQFVLGSWDKMWAFVGDSDYEPAPSVMACRQHRSPTTISVQTAATVSSTSR